MDGNQEGRHGQPCREADGAQGRLKSAPNFLDLEGEQILRDTEEDLEMDTLEPEREITPESRGAVPVPMFPSGLPEAVSGAETVPDPTSVPPPLTAAEHENHDLSWQVPVPESSGDELEFGDGGDDRGTVL